jgi:hypothetical protein
MKLRILRFFARRPLLLAALVPAFLIGSGALVTRGAWRGIVGESADSQSNPRMILGRGWFDSYPQKRTDNIKLFVFFGGGFGLYEEGSTWRGSIDFFEFERQGARLWIKFLQDGKVAESQFTVSPCDEKPPFDLCLDIPDTPRGPKRFYSFGDEDDFARSIPWGPQVLRAAQERARVP